MTPLNPFTYKFLNAQGDLKDFKHKSCQNEVERGKKKKKTKKTYEMWKPVMLS